MHSRPLPGDAHVAAAQPPPLPRAGGSSPHAVARQHTGSPTVADGAADGAQRLAHRDRAVDATSTDRAAADAPTDAAASAQARSASAERQRSRMRLPTPKRPRMIYARYLRSGRWVPVRVGALSLKGAALLAGRAAAARGSASTSRSRTASHRALVRGAVGKVSTLGEARATGAATFSRRRSISTRPSRRQLDRAAHRGARRERHDQAAAATRDAAVPGRVAGRARHDARRDQGRARSTSRRGGMFVRPNVPLELGSTLELLDRARRRRRADRRSREGRPPDQRRGEARAAGSLPGFGLGIVDMAEADRMRWLAFLARIERRAEKRVLDRRIAGAARRAAGRARGLRLRRDRRHRSGRARAARERRRPRRPTRR